MAKMNPYVDVLADAGCNPEKYKVCQICGYVNEAKRDECLYCAGYRFDTDAETVSNTVLEHAVNKKAPITSGDDFDND